MAFHRMKFVKPIVMIISASYVVHSPTTQVMVSALSQAMTHRVLVRRLSKRDLELYTLKESVQHNPQAVLFLE
jgi:hypothetical protein